VAFSIGSTCGKPIEGGMDLISTVAWPWSELEIEAQSDERAIRRAYARILKTRRVDEDVEAFQRLRTAYEFALKLAQQPSSDSEAPIVQSDTHAPPPGIEPETTEREAQLPTLPSIDPLTNPPITARQLWADFIATLGQRDAKAVLTELIDSVVNLSTRDELEHLALNYCLIGNPPYALFKDIAEVFGWRDDMKHLQRRDPIAAQRVLAKLTVEEGFTALCQRFPRAMALLADSPCSALKAFWVLGEKRMQADMEQLLAMLRGYYANVMHWKLDPQSVAFWDDRLAAQRRFFQHLGPALLVGACVGLLLALAADWEGPMLPGSPLIGFAIVMAGTMGSLQVVIAGVAAMLQPKSRERLERIRRTPFARFGWIGLWHCAIVLAMFSPGNSATKPAILVMLAIALEWAFAVQANTEAKRYLLPAVAMTCCSGLLGYAFGAVPVLVPAVCVHILLCAAVFSMRQSQPVEPARRRVMWAIGWTVCACGVAGLLLSGALPALAWAAYALLLPWCPEWVIPKRVRAALFAPAPIVDMLFIAAAGSIGRFPQQAGVIVFGAMASLVVMWLLSIWSREVKAKSRPVAKMVGLGLLALYAGGFPVPSTVLLLLGASVCVATFMYRTKFEKAV
jgi:hypothetical protein